MLVPSAPADDIPVLPAYVRAHGGVRVRFGRAGAATRRLELAESGGYRARFPERHDGVCEAVLINTGGGMAGGDAMRIDVSVGPGADAVVSSQAAEKIYRSQGPDTAIETSLAVSAGASLAWLPQESILFAGSRLTRRLTIDLAADSRLVACESVFFGRSAMGEVLGRAALHDRWRLRRDGRLVFADDVRLEGAVAKHLARPAIGGGAKAVATLVATGPGRLAGLDDLRGLLAGPLADVEGGAGVVSGILVVRLVSPDAQALRRALVTLLGHVTERAPPRTWSI